MEFFRRAAVLVAVVGLSVTSTAEAANILLNPSFETPVVTGQYRQYGFGEVIGEGWHVSFGNPALLPNGVYYGAGDYWPGAYEGNQYLYLGDGAGIASIYQDVSLLGATTYSLSFYQASFQTLWPGTPIAANVQVTVTDPELGVVLDSQWLLDAGPLGYVRRAVEFTTGSEGVYRLSFTQPDQPRITIIDSISLEGPGTDPTPVAVPDSGSSIMLLGLGLAALSLGVRPR